MPVVSVCLKIRKDALVWPAAQVEDLPGGPQFHFLVSGLMQLFWSRSSL